MANNVLTCPGLLSISGTGAPECSVSWTVTTLSAPFTVDQEAVTAVSEAFGVGFALVLTCWGLGFGIRTILSIIR